MRSPTPSRPFSPTRTCAGASRCGAAPWSRSASTSSAKRRGCSSASAAGRAWCLPPCPRRKRRRRPRARACARPDPLSEGGAAPKVEYGFEMDFVRALDVATEVALAAGEVLREDFHRPGGARGEDDKAEADVEAETLIRSRLLRAFPEWGYLGEETGRVTGPEGAPVWLVDPNDGTRDYLKGRRGSAVSIGLVWEKRAVLGVVYAFAYPDDRGDLFTWAEGAGPLRRNGRALEARVPETLGPQDVVLVSSKGDRDPEGNLRCADPARYRAVPSIAHRLALVAAGDAAAVTSLFAPGAWDYAAGHALLRPAGGLLVDESGAEVAYTDAGESKTLRAYAGSPGVARALAARPWESVGVHGRSESSRLARLAPGETIVDMGLLTRAHGALLGQVVGDSLGSLVEFQAAGAIAARYPDGPRRLEDGGTWDTLAGQDRKSTRLNSSHFGT